MELLPSADANAYLLQSLINARGDLRLVVDAGEAQVDVYLAGLLAAFLHWQQYNERAGEYLHDYDFEVVDAVDGGDEARAFHVLKANADHILVSLGVFRALPRPQERGTTRDGYVGRGKAYYTQAASYRKRIDRQNSARVEVLESLADGFETYLGILDRVRHEYLQLRTRISEGALFHLRREAKQVSVAGAIDTLLDAWNHKREGRGSEEAVADALADLRLIVPDFGWPPLD